MRWVGVVMRIIARVCVSCASLIAHTRGCRGDCGRVVSGKALLPARVFGSLVAHACGSRVFLRLMRLLAFPSLSAGVLASFVAHACRISCISPTDAAGCVCGWEP